MIGRKNKKVIFCCIKDEFTKIKFGEKEVDKKDFHSSKQAISLDSVDKSKIVVSGKWKINDTTRKFVIGYLNEDIIEPLSIILPQMSGFKYFDDGSKNMSFKIEDRNIYLKYSEILKKIKQILNVKFSAPLIHNEEYIKTKVKIFNGVNSTSFTNDEIPKEKNHYIIIAAISIDSVLKVEKKTHFQVYLEQCKYKLKKRKPVYFIYAEVELGSESNYEDN